MAGRLAQGQKKTAASCEAAAQLYRVRIAERSRRSASNPLRQSGIVTVLPANVIWLAAEGVAEIGGTLAAVIAGA
jgi:hypothetical protein